MTIDTELQRDQLLSFCTGYRKIVLRGRKVDRMCRLVVEPLSLALTELGIDNTIVEYEIDCNNCNYDTDTDMIQHFCIKIGSLILDPTADQFNDMPSIYFGPCPIWYLDPK